MPWKVFPEDGQYCVYKLDGEGEKTGKSLGCHDNRKDASKQMRAMYANAGEDFAVVGQHHIRWAELQTDESISERIRKVADAFDKLRFAPAPEMPMCYIREVFEDYIIVEQGEQLYKVTYSKDSDGVITFAERDTWKKAKAAYVEMVSGFEFVELQTALKSFDGLAASSDVPFVSMAGEEVYINTDDLPTFIENGLAVIESTRTSAGELVGLPIDLDGHNHKGGAGWIKGFELDNARSVVRFLVEWTEAGAELIRKGIRRFFSPSVDLVAKTILGGSLTNWPASRDGIGRILLRPIELSQNMKGIDMPATLDDVLARLAEIEGKMKPSSPDSVSTNSELSIEDSTDMSVQLRELLGDDDKIDELGEIAQRRATEIVRVELRKKHVVEFVSRVVGGTPQRPVGLPVRATELTKLLLSLPEKQSIAVEKILSKVWESHVDFAERGLNNIEDFSMRRQVPAEYKPLLTEWVARGKTPQSWFAANPEAGRAEDYNLLEFTKVED